MLCGSYIIPCLERQIAVEALGLLSRPWLLVDGPNAPARAALAFQIIEARQRAVLDRKGEDGLRGEIESNCKRGTDGAPMRDRDDIAASELVR